MWFRYTKSKLLSYVPLEISIVENLSQKTRGLFSSGSILILLIIGLGQFLRFGVDVVFPILLPYIKLEFSIGNTVAGLLLSSLAASKGLSQFPGGIFADVLGERVALTTSLVVASFGLIIIFFSNSLPALVVGMIIFGLGSGLFGTSRVTILVYLYPKLQATAIGITNALGAIGNSLIPPFALLLFLAYPNTTFGWRIGLGFAIPVFLLTAIILWIIVPPFSKTNPSSSATPLSNLFSKIFRALSKPSLLLITFSMVSMSIVYQGFTSFFPTYLISIKGIDESTAAGLFSIFFIGGLLIQPVLGWLSDKYGSFKPLIFTTALTAFGLLILPFSNGILPIALIVAIISLQLGFWPTITTYDISLLPTEAQGSSLGLQRTTFLLSGAAGPIIVGFMADSNLFNEAYYVLSLCAIVSFLTCIVLYFLRPSPQ
jgi:MFS family permease